MFLDGFFFLAVIHVTQRAENSLYIPQCSQANLFILDFSLLVYIFFLNFWPAHIPAAHSLFSCWKILGSKQEAVEKMDFSRYACSRATHKISAVAEPNRCKRDATQLY